jgi:aspartokinase
MFFTIDTKCNKYYNNAIIMKPVSSYVREIIDESEVALDALRDGILNLSAYAKKIRPEVARRARREVSLGTIVVALCRYEIDAKKRSPICPKVVIESISTRSALAEITFNKTTANRSRLRAIQENKKLAEADVLTIVSGVREISLIVPAALADELLKVFKNDEPTMVLNHLASITLQFSTKYINKPNTTFAMLRPLALQRINIVEVVSTYTELTVILAEKDLQLAFAVFSTMPTT